MSAQRERWVARADIHRFIVVELPGVATLDERASFARVIVAAPKLLEGLTRIMPFVDDAEDVQSLFPSSACSDECREAVKLCREAMAEATGSQS